MAHLKYLLSTRAGRAYVAHCLAEALDRHGEIHSSPQSTERFEGSALVLSVVKSRETKQGWVDVGPCPYNFIKALPPLIQGEEQDLAKKLSELKRLREHITQCQKRNTDLVTENRKLKVEIQKGKDTAEHPFKGF